MIAAVIIAPRANFNKSLFLLTLLCCVDVNKFETINQVKRIASVCLNRCINYCDIIQEGITNILKIILQIMSLIEDLIRRLNGEQMLHVVCCAHMRFCVCKLIFANGSHLSD